MKRVIEAVFYCGPLIFTVGFLWPLAAQILMRLDIASPWFVAALLCAPLGLQAQIRGRWV